MAKPARIALGLAFLLGGIVHLWFAGTALYEALSSVSWPTTQGIIVTSEVSFKPHYHIPHSPHLVYSYRVGSEQLLGSSIRIKDEGTTEAAAAATVSAYPVGKSVAVYFNPTNPSRAVLESGPTTLIAIWPALSVVVAAIGAFMLLGNPKTRRSASENSQ